jgi:CubicO group peptidase (beta-lactamase class C family)
MDGAMQAEIDAGHYAGISVMVARHGKLVKSRRYGYQSLEVRRPLREDAIYRIASMTKPIIAVAMMTLYEEGKWQLDDPVTKFIPEFADLKVMKDGELVPLDRPMTLRHMMSTSAGFAFGPAMGSTNPKVDALYAAADLWSGTNDEMIAKLAKLPLEAQPGTEFRYGLQQEVQGAIIRRISGEGLDAFLERRVFRPVRMKDTGFGVPEGQRDRIAPRYTVDANLKLVLAPDQSPFPAVAGTPAGVTPRMLLSIAGLYSTAQDYMRFAQMLANGGVLDGARDPGAELGQADDQQPAGGWRAGAFRPTVRGGRLRHEPGHRARSGAGRLQRRRTRRRQLLLGRRARHLVLGRSRQRPRRRRHGPAGKRRQPADRAALSHARHPRDFAVHHLRGAGRPRALVDGTRPPPPPRQNRKGLANDLEA